MSGVGMFRGRLKVLGLVEGGGGGGGGYQSGVYVPLKALFLVFAPKRRFWVFIRTSYVFSVKILRNFFFFTSQSVYCMGV